MSNCLSTSIVIQSRKSLAINLLSSERNDKFDKVDKRTVVLRN